MAFKDDLELSTAKETTTGGGFEDDLKLVEPSYNVIGGLKTLGGSILRAPENIAAAALTAIKGKEGATVTKSDWMTDYIKEVDIRNKERSAEVEKEYGKGTKFVPGIGRWSTRGFNPYPWRCRHGRYGWRWCRSISSRLLSGYAITS
jgi:hypothetical protein